MNAVSTKILTAQGFIDGYNNLVRQVELGSRRAVIILALAVTLIIGVLVFPAPAFSNQANLLNQPAVCTLACNPARQTCSRYPANQVPFRATRPNSVPTMYKMVPSGTRCDSSVCVQDPTMCFIGTF
jgi:hypothetical protein